MAENGNGNGDRAMSKIERAIPILTFLAVIIGGIWFGGGEWRSMQEKVASLAGDYGEIAAELKAVRLRIETIEQANAARRRGADVDEPVVTTPRFQPEWSAGR